MLLLLVFNLFSVVDFCIRSKHTCEGARTREENNVHVFQSPLSAIGRNRQSLNKRSPWPAPPLVVPPRARIYLRGPGPRFSDSQSGFGPNRSQFQNTYASPGLEPGPPWGGASRPTCIAIFKVRKDLLNFRR